MTRRRWERPGPRHADRHPAHLKPSAGRAAVKLLPGGKSGWLPGPLLAARALFSAGTGAASAQTEPRARGKSTLL